MRKTKLIITGKVQGVWYRAWMQKEALKYDIQGWVRNHQDGSVESLVVGLKQNVDTLIKACHIGPPHAAVEKITQKETKEEAHGFTIKETI